MGTIVSNNSYLIRSRARATSMGISVTTETTGSNVRRRSLTEIISRDPGQGLGTSSQSAAIRISSNFNQYSPDLLGSLPLLPGQIWMSLPGKWSVCEYKLPSCNGQAQQPTSPSSLSLSIISLSFNNNQQSKPLSCMTVSPILAGQIAGLLWFQRGQLTPSPSQTFRRR
jgi:hypothetical protein